MRLLDRIYIEVTNVCNLSCPFCPPHSRAAATMSPEVFSRIIDKIRGRAKTLYFHVKGEPLLHPDLSSLIDIASLAGFSVIITTNGTLLPERYLALAGKERLSRLNVSLHSLAQFDRAKRRDLASAIFGAVDALSLENRERNPRFLVSYRLWTRDRAEETSEILELLGERYSLEAGKLDCLFGGRNGCKLTDGIAVHAAETFDWPSLAGPDLGGEGFCHGLRDQAAILVDGTVVPCCLDGDGVVNLGNIIESDWDSIMEGPRARGIYNAFTNRKITEPLCRRCGYRVRFSGNQDA